MSPDLKVHFHTVKDIERCESIIRSVFPNARISDTVNPKRTPEKTQSFRTSEKHGTSWKQEVLELKLLTSLIADAVSKKDLATLQGFQNLFLALSLEEIFLPLKKYYPLATNPESTDFTTDVLTTFSRSIKACDEHFFQKPPTRNSAGRLRVYPRVGDLTFREIRLLVYTYGLNCGKMVAPTTLAQEEGIKLVTQAQENAKTHLIWALKNHHGLYAWKLDPS